MNLHKFNDFDEWANVAQDLGLNIVKGDACVFAMTKDHSQTMIGLFRVFSNGGRGYLDLTMLPMNMKNGS